MDSSVALVRTLELALTQLEAANLQIGPESEGARPAMRKWIEACRNFEATQGYDAIEWLEKTWLRRKGILVVGLVTAENVRTFLKKNGYEGLCQVISDDALLDFLNATLQSDLEPTVREIEGKIEETTARELVESVGLAWEPRDTSSSTTSEPVGAT